MYQAILIIHVLAAALLVALVLVQQGKGATIGAAFGSGASQTVFGSRGSGSFLMKVTIAFVVIFFSTSIALNFLASRAVKQEQTVYMPVQPTESKTVTPSNIPGNSSTQPVEKKK